MNTAEIVSVAIKLVLGAAAAFLAILVWAKTRDAAWMLIVLGTVANYIALVYSTLTLFGITTEFWLSKNAGLVVASAITCLPTLFFIAAFAVMVGRKYGIK
jgi:ABC-type glycerol-3-phosphate transport system permease component